ncbi:MAG: DUF2974 domain-containing protein [Clostridia bacterium]|nr:DUF2974 domain-containing protein [Clostridia bacterium]
MTNIFDYLKWRGDISFNAYPLNEIDSIIFSQLSYIPYDNIVSSDMTIKGISLNELYNKHFNDPRNPIKIGALFPEKKMIELIKSTAECERFKDVRIRGYVNEIDLKHEKQFSAMCFDLPDNTTYVAFRGTDDTIVGWKEDFNMSLFTPVPAQKEAVDYLNEVGKHTENKLYVGGHSKGGNLSIYSSFLANKETQEKIIKIHSFDGPGFRFGFLKQARKNRFLVERVTNFIPESAIIGAIFDTIGKRIYIKSKAKSGLRQHDVFTWKIEYTKLGRALSLSESSIQFHNSLEEMVADMTEEEKKDLVEALYKLGTANDAETLSDILTNKFKFISALFKVDGKSKKTMWKSFKDVFKRYLGIDTKKTTSRLTKHDKEVLQKASVISKNKIK